ncbi:hypothetical protein [Rhodococcoides kroppenstedtii]|uniref:hypothetical protein n=1 Tax=Rhodococcoides kroppenstedtii TaxID=293050 RepID=UPI001427D9FD|nr:hypothetical protein [Rhodococcus kroppenstedtii]NIL81990.1 hypothetical protein [Rhodococcus kroppenstedtii]
MPEVRYGVVLNDLCLPDGDVHGLGSGWELRRPTDAQIEQFRPRLTMLYNAMTAAPRLTPPPHEAVVTGVEDSITYEWSLAPSDFRYWVAVRVDSDGLPFRAFVEALTLADTELCLNYWPNGAPDLSPTGARMVANPTTMATFFADVLCDEQAPQQADLGEIRELVTLRAQLDGGSFPEIARMLGLFESTAQLPDRSPQKFLAHMAIVEGLLTHAPGPTDRVDTIGRQLKRNIVLLDHRMPDHRKTELDSFGSTKPQTVIDKLYAYRSAVAHGTDPSDRLDVFAAKWPGPTTVLSLHQFARQLTKRLLAAALREPQLVSDLKG